MKQVQKSFLGVLVIAAGFPLFGVWSAVACHASAEDDNRKPRNRSSDAQSRDASVSAAPARDAPSRDAPARDAPARDAPARAVTAPNAPARYASVSHDSIPDAQVTFFVLPRQDFLGLDENAMRLHFIEIRDHCGTSSKWGKVGFGFNFPYTALLDGSGPDRFVLQESALQRYELATKVARQLNMPIMVGLNGGVWAESQGAFNDYWKTVDGGKYLSRYSDGRVNQSIDQITSPLDARTLQPFLSKPAGDPDHLTLTESSFANSLENSRVNVLQLATRWWADLAKKNPGTIVALTIDSEVSYFSFRRDAAKQPVPIGYEDLLMEPFCKDEGVKKEQLIASIENDNEAKSDTNTSIAKKWHRFRSEQIYQFEKHSVDAIKKQFPNLPVYTHQIACLDEEYVKDGYDFDSPMATGVIPEAVPGYTVYVWSHYDNYLHKFLEQLTERLHGAPWGAMEFNCGKDWHSSAAELRTYTRSILTDLYYAGANVVTPFSWNSSKLDSGIKDSGVDAGVKDFIELGPLPKNKTATTTH